MRTGDLQHMPKAERLPWRVYTRDYIDARFNIGEFFIPVALVILIASVILTAVYPNPVVTLILMTVLYVYLFAIVIDVVVMWRKLKKLLIAKYGEQSVAKGMRTGSYAWSRAIQLRRWRLPKPRYKLLIAKYGEQSVAKGMRTGSYAWSRAIQLRRWRLPKPRYKKRGHWPK